MTTNGVPTYDPWYSETAEQTTERLRRIREDPPPTADIGRGLIYPGQITTCFGEPDAGKSLLAAAIGAEEANNGHATLWIDFEQGADRTLRRLTEFGATDHTLTTSLDRIHYPMGTPPTELFKAFEGIQLVIIDALTGLLTAMGLSSNSDTDIETAYALALRPFAALGAGVFVIDHVVKRREEQGRWATGSQRKIGAADVALKFDSVQRFKPGHGGKARITVSRDRDGAVQHSIFTLEPNQNWHLDARTDIPTNDGEFRYTGFMERISRYLESNPNGASGNQIEQDIKGSNEHKRKALKTLINEDYVETKPGPNNGIIHISKRAFREDSDPGSPTSPPVRRDLAAANPAGQFAGSPSSRKGSGKSGERADPPSEPRRSPEYEPPDEYYESITDIN